MPRLQRLECCRKWQCVIAVFLILLGFSVLGETVVFHLSSGDRISGAILWENEKSVCLSNRWASEITLPRNQIVRRSDVSQAAQLQPPLTPSITRVTPVPSKKAPSSVLNGEAQVGVDLLFGAQERQIVFSRFKLAFTRPYVSDPKQYFRNVFDLSAEIGRTDGEKSSERLYASDKTSFDLEKRWYIYNLVGGGHDYRLRIDLQYEAGPGVGYHLITRTNFTLNVEGGLNYQAQFRRFSEDGRTSKEEVEDVYYRLAEEFAWKRGRFSMVEKLEFFPRANLTEFRARFDATLSYELWKNLAVNLTFLDFYDSQPAEDASRNELQIRSSLGLKF